MTAALWIFGSAVAFFVLRTVGSRYFNERGRAALAAACTVAAFLLGAAWPFSDRAAVIATSAPPPAEPAAPDRAAAERTFAALGGTDVRSACTALRLGNASVTGHVDSAGIVRDGHVPSNVAPIEGAPHDLIAVTGWAADAQHVASAKAVCPIVDGVPLANARVRYGTPRPDVASTFQRPALAASGFAAAFQVEALPRGSHRVTFAVVTASGSVGQLPDVIAVTVR